MKQKECLLAALLLLPLTAMAALEASDLRVESLRSPLGIDTQTPAFSWLLNSDERDCTQVSYAIIVTKADGTQVWYSGTVPSNQHTGIAYAGTVLESCSAYSWTVTLTDNRGRTATCTSSFARWQRWLQNWVRQPMQRRTHLWLSVPSQPSTQNTMMQQRASTPVSVVAVDARVSRLCLPMYVGNHVSGVVFTKEIGADR